MTAPAPSKARTGFAAPLGGHPPMDKERHRASPKSQPEIPEREHAGDGALQFPTSGTTQGLGAASSTPAAQIVFAAMSVTRELRRRLPPA